MQTVAGELQTVTQLRRVVAAFALALFASTWRLWTPQTVFPQVPLLHSAGRLPGWADWVGLGVMSVAMLSILLARRTSSIWRIGGGAFVGAFVVMVLIDQHRLQPWAYQFALIAAVLALVPDGRGLSLVRVLTIGIYLHSALSKLDASFFESHGPYLIGGLAHVAGLQLEKWSPSWQRNLAATLPLGELLIAVGLSFRRTRLASLIGAVVMHALLIAALGPWSLDHELGVLIWNGYFIVQDILLFFRSSKLATTTIAVESPKSRWPVVSAAGIVALAVILPFLEPFGLFDAWPAWALYASRPARVSVLITSAGRERLPAELKPYVQDARFSDLLFPIRVDRWSLDATHAPIYPAPRFELGVALAIMAQPGLEGEVCVDIESAADRWTGKRTVSRISGAYDMRLAAEFCWFNAMPRIISSD